jgi:hypothetical protein
MKQEALNLFDDLASREGEIFSQACGLITNLLNEIERLESLVVYAPDISLKGTHSEEYERGFWDAVDVVREMQGTQNERYMKR